MGEQDQNHKGTLTSENRRRQKNRNIAVALTIVAFIVIIFFVTIIRIEAGIEAARAGG